MATSSGLLIVDVDPCTGKITTRPYIKNELWI